MFTIKTLNAISPVGLAKLNKNLFDVSVDADAPDGILVRSADLLNTTFNDGLLAIARAGAGVNNIPLDRCSEQGIVVFNTPGANANAVAELVIGMLIAGSRNVPAAAQWTQGLAGDPAMAKSVEKGKKQFVGNEIKGKTLGVIGLGAIGSRVANCAIELGMEVYGYDPYISIDAAWNLSSQVRHCVNLNDMLPLCDYITIHVPYLPTTKDTINAQTLALCKDGVKLLNYARRMTDDPSDAEDAVQEVMLKLWNLRQKLDEYRSIEAVAMTMTHHLCMDMWRAKRPDTLSLDRVQAPTPSATPERLLEEKDEFRLMREIIDSLPTLQRTIIRMKDIEEYETEEIAEITGCNAEAIRSNLSRARKKVREVYLQTIQERKRRNKA